MSNAERLTDISYIGPQETDAKLIPFPDQQTDPADEPPKRTITDLPETVIPKPTGLNSPEMIARFMVCTSFAAIDGSQRNLSTSEILELHGMTKFDEPGQSQP